MFPYIQLFIDFSVYRWNEQLTSKFWNPKLSSTIVKTNFVDKVQKCSINVYINNYCNTRSYTRINILNMNGYLCNEYITSTCVNHSNLSFCDGIIQSLYRQYRTTTKRQLIQVS
jgi:hypothetical protein